MNTDPLPIQMGTHPKAGDEILDMVRYLVTTIFEQCPETLTALNAEGYTVCVSTVRVNPSLDDGDDIPF